MTQLWGLWHNGWACFRTTTNPDRLGWGYAGTKEESQVGQDLFVLEGGNRAEYEVIPFDAAKEPEGTVRTPSAAQVEALSYVERVGDVNRFPAPRNWRQTVTSISRWGWVFANFSEDGQQDYHRYPLKLTAVGRQVLGR